METAETLSSSRSQPSTFAYVLGFLLVGISWGFTTPFLRIAAVEEERKRSNQASQISKEDGNRPWAHRKAVALYTAVLDLLRRPGYSIPLALNLAGGIWFFLLVGQAELSLTVPITNSLAFLFTVLGEWWAEGKVITRGAKYPPPLLRMNLTFNRHLARNDTGTSWDSPVRAFKDMMLCGQNRHAHLLLTS